MDIEIIVKKMQSTQASAFNSGSLAAEKAEYGSDYEQLPKKMKDVENGIMRHLAQIGAYTVLGEEIHLDRYRQLARYCGAYYAMARIGQD